MFGVVCLSNPVSIFFSFPAIDIYLYFVKMKNINELILFGFLFQDGATKILHNHVKNASSHSDSDVLSPRNATSPVSRLRPPSR